MRTGIILLATFAIVSSSAIAGPISFVRSDYRAIAEARAHDVFDSDLDQGSSLLPAYTTAVWATATYEDPILGFHSAQGNASLQWLYADSISFSRISGQVGGVAEAFSNGLETYALGAGSVQIYFDVTSLSNGKMSSEGTFNSDLYRWDGSNWAPYETGLNGTIERLIEPGSYRWDSGAGGEVTGSSFQSAGIDFYIEATVVPEPASWIALTGATVALLRRRRRAAGPKVN